MSRSRNVALAAAALLAFGLGASSARAEILAQANRAGNFTSTASSVLLPLGGSGATSLPFTTTTPNERVRITYNAECAALGDPTFEDYIAVVIAVDGQPAKPNSGGSFAMCTATSTTDFSWVGAVRQSIYFVPTPGVHSVTVTGLLEGATELWQGDSSTVVDR